MSVKVYTLDKIKESRLLGDKKVVAPLFEGNRFENLTAMRGPSEVLMSAKSADENRQELEALRYKITMAAQAPTQAEIEAFFGKFYVDVTRKAQEAPDLTSLIAQEVTNYEFPETVNLRDVLPFRGQMATVSGANDAVPLIEPHIGNVDTMSLAIKAVGWKTTLKNELFNKAFSTDKVVQAAVDADVDARNQATAGVMIGATYDDSQTQAYVSTSGLTYDEKMYETILAAVKKLKALKDGTTKRKIASPRINILCNSSDTWSIENVIRGQLNGNSAKSSNRPALPINAIVEYDQGINDGFLVGKETASVPGVTAGTIYLYVPDVLLVASKRPFTMETGRGSVLELSTQEYAWYRVQGVYSKTFLGSSYPGTALTDGFGYTVKAAIA